MSTVIAYGGGVQSTALVVLAATGRLEADAALFCNVGDDSENPGTVRYVREVVIPWAAERGFPVHEIERRNRRGEPETLMQVLLRSERSFDIPVRMANGAPGRRNCTREFKIKVMTRWVRRHAGATEEHPATVLVGISTDEMERAGRRRQGRYEVTAYPLLDLGLDRSACLGVIRDAGLPLPGKSACWFCPFTRPQQFAEMRRDDPERFEQCASLEDLLNERRAKLGLDPVFLTRFGLPLREAVPEAQPDLWSTLPGGIGEGGCDEGYCFV